MFQLFQRPTCPLLRDSSGEIDKNVVREENYKGEFYEISPYSYQRNRFKQGKIVGNVTSLKTTNNLFTYYFDVKIKL